MVKKMGYKRIQRKETLDKLENLNSKTVYSLFEKIVNEFPNDKEGNLNLFANISN